MGARVSRGRFRRLTRQQRAELAALALLGGVVTVTADNARTLHALKRRGLVRFARDESGAKIAYRRLSVKQRRARARAARRLGDALLGLSRAYHGGADL